MSEFLTWFNPIAGVVAFVTGGYTFYKNVLEKAKVSIALGGWMAIVVGPERPRRIHIRGALLNDAVKLGTLQHLEAEVKAPDKSVQRYVWNQPLEFVTGSNNVQPAGRPTPVPVPGKSSKPLLAQLELVAPNTASNWASGRHEIKVLGWVNCKNRQAGPNVTSVFHINIPGGAIPDLPQGNTEFQDFPVEEWNS